LSKLEAQSLSAYSFFLMKKKWRSNFETSALWDKPCGHQILARTDVETSGSSHLWNTWKSNCAKNPQSANELLFSKSCNIKVVSEPIKCRPTTCGIYNISKNAFHFLFLLQYVIVVDRFELNKITGFPLEHLVPSSKYKIIFIYTFCISYLYIFVHLSTYWRLHCIFLLCIFYLFVSTKI